MRLLRKWNNKLPASNWTDFLPFGHQKRKPVVYHLLKMNTPEILNTEKVAVSIHNSRSNDSLQFIFEGILLRVCRTYNPPIDALWLSTKFESSIRKVRNKQPLQKIRNSKSNFGRVLLLKRRKCWTNFISQCKALTETVVRILNLQRRFFNIYLQNT